MCDTAISPDRTTRPELTHHPARLTRTTACRKVWKPARRLRRRSTAQPSEPTPAPLPGKFFNITLTRTGTTLAVSIDGAKAFAVQPTSFAVTGFALRPWRSTMQIRSFRVCAAALPAPGAPPPPPPSVFSPGEAGVPIYRIPVRKRSF